jgi:hypothetical protein
MSLLRSLSDGLRSLFRKERVEGELDEELRGFLEMAAEEKMKQGMSRKDALRAVRLERGSLEVSKEVVCTAGWESFVETLWQDLRFAARMLRKVEPSASFLRFGRRDSWLASPNMWRGIRCSTDLTCRRLLGSAQFQWIGTS